MDIIDLHCDTLYKAVTEDISFDCERVEAKLNDNPQRCRMQCYAIWIPDTYTGDRAEAMFHTAYRRLQQECEQHHVSLLSPCEPVKSRFLTSINTAFYTVENASVLNGKLENVRLLSACGVRMMTLTWNAPNQIGDGADVKNAQGITDFGKKVIAEMEQHHIMIDVSHASKKLFYDIAEITKKPFVASHSNAYAVTPHRRNLTNEQFEIICHCGGLVGINFHNAFLNKNPEKASTEDVIRHIEHFLSLGGEDVICFGSDFDGGTLPADITDSRIYDKIYELLCRRNYKESLIQKIFYANALNFFENFDNR